MGRPPQPGAQFKLRLNPQMKKMLDDAAAQNRRTLSAEIIDRLELSFTPYADPEAMSKAYEQGRRDALLERSPDDGEGGLHYRTETEIDAQILFETLPPAARDAVLPILAHMARLATKKGG